MAITKAPKARAIDDFGSGGAAHATIIAPHSLPMFKEDGAVGTSAGGRGTKRRREKERHDPQKTLKPSAPMPALPGMLDFADVLYRSASCRWSWSGRKDRRGGDSACRPEFVAERDARSGCKRSLCLLVTFRTDMFPVCSLEKRCSSMRRRIPARIRGPRRGRRRNRSRSLTHGRNRMRSSNLSMQSALPCCRWKHVAINPYILNLRTSFGSAIVNVLRRTS